MKISSIHPQNFFYMMVFHRISISFEHVDVK